MMAFDTVLRPNLIRLPVLIARSAEQQEKGRAMAQDGEPQIKRRTKNMGSQDPLALPTKGATKSVPLPHTDAYHMDEGADIPRSGSTAIRYDQPASTQSQRLTNPRPATRAVPARRQSMTRDLPPARLPRPTTQQPPKPDKASMLKNGRVHWLFLVGIGMLAALVLWMLASSALAWGIQRYNDIRYGTPRTYQTDHVVGQGGDSPAHPSHFIAINENRQAIVIEFMAGDPSKSEVYVAPVTIVGAGGDLAPVTLQFRDVTGDGKVDMIIDIHLPNSQDELSVFVNIGTKFRPSNGNDKINV